MAVSLPVEPPPDTAVLPIDDVCTITKLQGGRVRVVIGSAEYVSGAAATLVNIKQVLRHARREGREVAIVALAKARGIIPNDVFKFDIQPT